MAALARFYGIESAFSESVDCTQLVIRFLGQKTQFYSTYTGDKDLAVIAIVCSTITVSDLLKKSGCYQLCFHSMMVGRDQIEFLKLSVHLFIDDMDAFEFIIYQYLRYTAHQNSCDRPQLHKRRFGHFIWASSNLSSSLRCTWHSSPPEQRMNYSVVYAFKHLYSNGGRAHSLWLSLPLRYH